MEIFAAIGFTVAFVLVVVPVLFGMILVAITGRRAGSGRAALLAAVLLVAYVISPFPRVAVGTVYLLVPETRPSIVRLDLALSRLQREAVIGMADRGELPTGRLPWWASGLSSDGQVDFDRRACGRHAFFGGSTGFVFADPGCDPDPNPDDPGLYRIQDLGGGWYWVQER